MRVIKILLLIFFVTACKSQKPIVDTTSKVVKDSTYVKERIIPKDTLIVVPADSLRLTARIQDITEKEISKKVNRLRLSLKREGDKIIAKCNEDELLLQIALLEKEIEIRKEVHTELQTTVNHVVKYVPKVVKWLAWIGGIFILLIGIGVVLRVKRII